MTERSRGLLDTSVLVDFEGIDPRALPEDTAVSAISLAELAAGPYATDDLDERARRMDRVLWVTATWDPIPFDAAAARAYGRLWGAAGAAGAAGRTSRGRKAGFLIAATAAANGLPIYTRNPGDLEGLGAIVEIVSI